MRFYSFDNNGLPIGTDSEKIANSWVSEHDFSVLDTVTNVVIMGKSGQVDTVTEHANFKN